MPVFVNFDHILQGLGKVSKVRENSPRGAAVDSSFLIYGKQTSVWITSQSSRVLLVLKAPFPQLARGVNVSLKPWGWQPSPAWMLL